MNIQSISNGMYRQNFCANQNQPKVVAIALPLETIENKNILQTLQDVFVPQKLERDVVDIGTKSPEGITNMVHRYDADDLVDDLKECIDSVALGYSTAGTGTLGMTGTSAAPEEMTGLTGLSLLSS